MEYICGIATCIVALVFAHMIAVGIVWQTVPPERLPGDLFELVGTTSFPEKTALARMR